MPMVQPYGLDQIVARARLERATIEWRQRARNLKPEYGTDSEEAPAAGEA